MMYDHLLERGATFRERGVAFGALINVGKAWVIGYYERVTVARELLGKERRPELERLKWEAVKKQSLHDDCDTTGNRRSAN